MPLDNPPQPLLNESLEQYDEHCRQVPLLDPPHPLLKEPLRQYDEHCRQVPPEDPPHPDEYWPAEHWLEQDEQLAASEFDANVPLGHDVQMLAEDCEYDPDEQE